MTIQFRTAVRKDAKVQIGLAGPSGSGKTFSALTFAKGLAQGAPVFLIDTEAGRAAHYAELFDFQHGELVAPFLSERYLEAIQGAHTAGAAVIIVDSMSHEHEGPGGILEQHDNFLNQHAGTDHKKRERLKFSAWIKPKAAHNKFVNSVLQIPVHMIYCFRAKDKLQLVKNDRGRQEPVSAGLQAICSDRFEYEMTSLLVLPAGSQGVPDLGAKATKVQQQHKTIFPPGKAINEGMGRAIATWAAGPPNQSSSRVNSPPAITEGPSESATNSQHSAPGGPNPDKIAAFWARANLAIPVEGTLTAWVSRFLAAAATARDEGDLDRLKLENEAPRMRLKVQDEPAFVDLCEHLDQLEKSLMGGE